MTFPSPRFLNRDGFNMALYEAGPDDGPLLILIHGWPELAYSWKNQIGPLTEAGYRVIAYDLRGFGHSDAPLDPAHYGIAHMVSDVEAIIDDAAAASAALIGHDWGGIILWHAARMLPGRISHLISLCTPHVRRAPVDPITIFRQRYGDEHYFVHFTDHPGKADALFASDPDAFFRLMLRSTPASAKLTSDMFHIPARFQAYLDAGAPPVKGAVMTAKDAQVYVDGYARSGFHGGLNLYRNTSANWQLAEGLSDHIAQPTLMISGERDLFLPAAYTTPMTEMVPRLERHIIDGCGHWMMWERPDEVNALMLGWLSQQTL